VIPTSFRLVAGGYSATWRTVAAWSMMVTVDGVPAPRGLAASSAGNGDAASLLSGVDARLETGVQ